MLHRLAKAQVDPEGKCGYQLGKPYSVGIAITTVHTANASPARRPISGPGFVPNRLGRSSHFPLGTATSWFAAPSAAYSQCAVL